MGAADLSGLAATLARLEGLWRQAGMAVDDLAPGGDTWRIQEVGASVGLVLPDELIVLLGWHDGTLPYAPALLLPTGFRLFSISEAVAAYEEARGSLIARAKGESPWPYGWLPMARDAAGRTLSICALEDPTWSAEVKIAETTDFDPRGPGCPSLHVAVRAWADVLTDALAEGEEAPYDKALRRATTQIRDLPVW